MSTGGVTDLLSSLVDGVDAASMPLVVSNQDLLDAIGRSEESLTLHAAPDVTDIVGGGVSAQVWSLVQFFSDTLFSGVFQTRLQLVFRFPELQKDTIRCPHVSFEKLLAQL